MSTHISDEPVGEPERHDTPTTTQHSGSGSSSDPLPPVDPTLLDDYENQQAFREFLEERQRKQQREAAAADNAPATLDVNRLVLEIPDGDDVHTFETVDVTDENVLAHLQILITFSDTDMDRAGALFEALLGPHEYDRLRKTIRPMIRRIGAAWFDDPENNPSIQDVWINMARTISEPIRRMQADPKDSGSQHGRSHTGHSSSIGSETKSALPPSG